MSGGVWLMIMDLLVMVLLGAMLFYAIRLQKQLSAFRAERQNLEKLVADLADNVTKAEQAIMGLKETARAAGRDLQSRIDGAKSLSDELQLISEAGNSLANRLEKGGTQGGFAIRDAEFERGGDATPQYQTQAERDLAEALRTRRRQ